MTYFVTYQCHIKNGRNEMVHEQRLSAFENFIYFNSHKCFISNYGHSPISFKALEDTYGQWYFIVLELNEKLKVFYLKGSREKFKKRVDELLNVFLYYYYSDIPKLLMLGYIPSLFSIDFSSNQLGDALRIDFLKHGQMSYDTGENLIGNLYTSFRLKLNEYSRSRYLDFDYSKWILRKRKLTFKQ